MFFILRFNRRQAYQPEEDEAIMNYVASHQAEFGMDGSTGGNLIWKKMEEQIVCLQPH